MEGLALKEMFFFSLNGGRFRWSGFFVSCWF